MINQNLKILLFCTAQDYNQAISHVILSQIFDNARNAFSILSDQYTDNSSFMVVKAGIDQEETESSDLKKKEAVCRILRFWFIMKI